MLKPDNDHREYRYLTLENGVNVLLVYDPRMDDHAAAKQRKKGDKRNKSSDWLVGTSSQNLLEDEDEVDDTVAAAAAIRIGSFSDPMQLQGASHFLEHMIFLGSEKYPGETDTDAYLTRNGGGSNAWTELEYTCFYLDVAADALSGALDRFAQFFVSPLLRESSMEREVNAVDSEFVSVLQSDSGRLTQLMCHTAQPEHPYNKFGWGSKESLWDLPKQKGVDIQRVLSEYYAQYYGSQNLNLAVLGAQPLDKMQKLVEDTFGGVRRAPQDCPDYAAAGYPFTGNKFYMMASVMDTHTLTVTWQWPSQTDKYERKAAEYVGHVLGHEGKGSLLSELKRLGWATDIDVGSDDDGYHRNAAVWLFSVAITLTDKGLDASINKQDGLALSPLDLVFEAVALSRESGVQRWIWDELKAMAHITFKYQPPPEDISDWVSELPPAMLTYKPQHLLAGPSLYGDFDPAHLQELLDSMAPSEASSLRVDLQTKAYADLAPALASLEDHEEGFEPWFRFKYAAASLPKAMLSRWSSAAPDARAKLLLPEVNRFIPNGFDLVCEAQPVQKLTPPTLERDVPGLRLWHRTSVFGSPIAQVTVKLASPVLSGSPEAEALSLLTTALWDNALVEEAYAASAASLDVGISYNRARKLGLSVSINGFSDKIELLVEAAFKALAQLSAANNGSNHMHDRFELAREQVVKSLGNAYLEVDEHAEDLLEQILYQDYCNVSTLLPIVASKSLDDVHAHAAAAAADMHIEMLSLGNLLPEESASIANGIVRLLPSAALPAAARPCQRVMKLAKGITYVHRTDAANPHEQNSAYMAYFQVGLEGAQSRAMVELVVELMSERAYDVLRTKEQLGYVVDVTETSHGGVLGLAISITTKERPDKVDERVDAFLIAFEKELGTMKRDEFLDFRHNIDSAKLSTFESLAEEHDSLWSAIAPATYAFRREQQERAALANINLKDVRAWYAKHLSPSSRDRRKLRIQVVGKHACGSTTVAMVDPLSRTRHHKPSPHEVEIIDIDLIKSRLDTYPTCAKHSAASKQGRKI